MRDPAVFLMDEPLSNLDAKLRVQMRTEITKIHKNLHATIIYVTHDQVEAMTMGTKIVVMDNGVIQQVAAPTELYQKPENMFVAGFIGSSAMNFIKGTVVVNGQSLNIEFLGYSLLLTPEKAEKIMDVGFVGKEVIFGIRPEHMRCVEKPEEHSNDPKDAQIDVNVDVVEALGAENIIYYQLDGRQCAARAAECCCKPGDTIRIGIDIKKVHVFDPETRGTITN